jgi:hypothetical protein
VVTVQELIIELVKGCPMSAEVEVEVWRKPVLGSDALATVACEIRHVCVLERERRATLQIWLPWEETP